MIRFGCLVAIVLFLFTGTSAAQEYRRVTEYVVTTEKVCTNGVCRFVEVRRPVTRLVAVAAKSTACVVSTLADVAVAPVRVAANYVDRAGYHRHVLADGTVIEHHDSNYGSASAHVGVTSWGGSTWTKYTGPLAPGQVKTTTVGVSNCPGGVCPLPGSTVVTSSTSSGSCPNCPQVATTIQTDTVTGYVATYATVRSAPRFFGWIRPWRAARLSARAARWSW